MAKERYQLQDQIAKGDFATVFRAYDHELKRDVAVKQIHQQYLSDPQQLDRYWQEAQILAALEHPHVTTIYDIVRERGWLILELMQGSLQQLLDGHPIDLNDLRLAVTFTLHGLQFMHENGIVHGDVKPSNLLVDRNNRVKLGDFGIARRLAGDDGSVVKGTTKFIAPEVVSDQFGEVGPHSDLYSLGFAAFDLMCGSNFDSLFPGLNMYGRDQQIAWMMWHSAPDRRLPEVQKVLEGVPDDLAFIVQRLTEKDPRRRYQTAQEVIEDLNSDGPLKPAPEPEEVARAEKAERQAKQKKLMLIGAVCVSLMLSLSMVFIPSGPKEKPPAAKQDVPNEAVMLLVDLEHQRFLVRPKGGKQVEIKVGDKVDVTILLNDKVAQLNQLRGGDHLSIQSSTRVDGKKHLQIKATRPKGTAVEGSLIAANAVERFLALTLPDGKKLQLHVPSAAKVTLNGISKIKKRATDIGDLNAGDRISLTYYPSTDGTEQPVAFDVVALRDEVANGYINAIDKKKRLMTLRFEKARGGTEKSLPIAPACQVTLNGLSKFNDKPLTISDLLADDEIEVKHDDQIHAITARRSFRHSGSVAEVAADTATDSMTVSLNGKVVTVSIASDSSIHLTGDTAEVPYRYIRPGDQVTIIHESPELKNPTAKEIEIQLRPDPRVWVLLIGQHRFDDSRITQLPHVLKDVARLQKELTGWYRVPIGQIQLAMDASKSELQKGVETFLKRVPADAVLSVFFLGNGYKTTGGSILATRDTQFDRLAATGYSLRSLFDELEACKAKKKSLFLDTSHYVARGAAGKDLALQPSAAVLANTLRASPTRPVSKTVAVIASCTDTQKGLRGSDGNGLFCSVLVDAFSGKADADRNFQLTPKELFTFTRREMTVRLTKQQRQTPQLFEPDDSPTRLSSEAQDAIKKVLAYLDAASSAGLDLEFENAKAQAPNDPEPTLAYAMVQLKRGKRFDSLRSFQKLVKRHPKSALGHQGLSFQYFQRHDYAVGVRHVALLVKSLEIEPGAATLKPLQRQLLEYAGVLRAYASDVAAPQRPERELVPIDRQVTVFGTAAQSAFKAGQGQLKTKLRGIERRIKNARSASDRTKFQRERKQIGSYTRIRFIAIRQHLLRTIIE